MRACVGVPEGDVVDENVAAWVGVPDIVPETVGVRVSDGDCVPVALGVADEVPVKEAVRVPLDVDDCRYSAYTTGGRQTEDSARRTASYRRHGFRFGP